MPGKRARKSKGQFSSATKAQIFAWDRAVCAFTGANLWVLDYGVSPLYEEDWMDHIKPAARRGSNQPANGVCAGANANWVKGANGRANAYWFIGGRPTCNFYESGLKVPEATAELLRREVKERDWYFNHCLRNLVLAVGGRTWKSDGYKRHKNKMYYPKAAFRFLQEFRTAWQRDHESVKEPSLNSAVRDWKSRGLLRNPVTQDQRALLEVLDASSEEEVARLAGHLVRFYKANDRWLLKMDRWTKSCDRVKGQSLICEMSKDKLVSPIVKDVLRHNVRVLNGLPKPVRGEEAREVVRRWDDYE